MVLLVAENSTLVEIFPPQDAGVPPLSLEYTISGADQDLFQIRNGNELHFIQAPDFEGRPDAVRASGYAIELLVLSTQGLDSIPLIIEVTDVNEYAVTVPADSDPAPNMIDENATGPVGVTVSALDGDGSLNIVTYSLVSAGDGQGPYTGPFSIDPDTGEVSLTRPLNFETDGPLQKIDVLATSEDGWTSLQTFSITINDINEFVVSLPADLNAAANEIRENSIGAVGVTALAADSDGTLNTITYALVGDEVGSIRYVGPFGIDPETGVVRLAEAVDYETTGPMVTIFVQVTSSDGTTAVTPFEISVIDVNEFSVSIATDADSTLNAIDENSTGAVGVIASAADADGTLNAVTYSLVGDISGQQLYSGPFSIDPTTGEISLDAALNYEVDGASQTVHVRADSQDGSHSIAAFSILINDINELTVPSDSDALPNAIHENAVGVIGVTVLAVDQGGLSDSVTYSLVGDGEGLLPYNGPFLIDAVTGQIRLGSALNYEADGPVVTLFVRALSPAGGLSGVSVIDVHLDDVNEFAVTMPTDTNAAVNTIVENTTGPVGLTAQAMDADGTTNAVTYALAGDGVGDTLYNGPFTINPTTGDVSLSLAQDFEASVAAIPIFIVATSADGSRAVSTFLISLTDVNEAPTSLSLSANTVPENSVGGTFIGQLGAFDPDARDAITFRLIDNADGRFAIDPQNRLVVAAGALLDFEAQTSFPIVLEARDQAGLWVRSSLTVSLSNVNEAPVITSSGGAPSVVISMAENLSVVSTVSAVDPDSGASVTYSIAGGVDANRFTIDATSGQLRFVAAPDFEAPADQNGDNRYSVIVNASDGLGGFATQSIDVVVPNAVGVTIQGTGAAETIGATSTPPGQPFPTNEEDMIFGNGGNDILSGLAGNDALFGGSGIDAADYSAFSTGLIAVLNGGAGSVRKGTTGTDTLSSIETFLGGSGADNVYSAGGMSVYGGGGNDILVLTGGGGINLQDGGAGSDYIYGGTASGTNTMHGGAGLVDVILGSSAGQNDLYGDGGGYDYFFAMGGITTFHAEATAAGDVEVMNGGAGAVTMYGGQGTNYYYTGTGPATMYGGSGINIYITSAEAQGDTIFGGSGPNYLYGGNHGDTVFGGSGTDVFVCGAGADTVEGLGGVNYAWGGGGSDTFVLDVARDDIFVIQDFGIGGVTDVVRFVNSGLTSFVDVQSHSFYAAGINTTIATPIVGHAVWLIGVGPDQLSASNFTFG